MAVLVSSEVIVEVTMRDRDQMRRCQSLIGPEVVSLVQRAFCYCYALVLGRSRRLVYDVDVGVAGWNSAWEPLRFLNTRHYWVMKLEKPVLHRKGTWLPGKDSGVFLVSDGQTGVLTNLHSGQLHVRLSDLFPTYPGRSLCVCFGRRGRDEVDDSNELQDVVNAAAEAAVTTTTPKTTTCCIVM